MKTNKNIFSVYDEDLRIGEIVYHPWATPAKRWMFYPNTEGLDLGYRKIESASRLSVLQQIELIQMKIRMGVLK